MVDPCKAPMRSPSSQLFEAIRVFCHDTGIVCRGKARTQAVYLTVASRGLLPFTLPLRTAHYRCAACSRMQYTKHARPGDVVPAWVRVSDLQWMRRRYPPMTEPTQSPATSEGSASLSGLEHPRDSGAYRCRGRHSEPNQVVRYAGTRHIPDACTSSRSPICMSKPRFYVAAQ